jgi:Ion transport protein
MIFVLCICWLRFFTYFLVIRDISKLLLILIAMIGDTMAFMFIVCCFILIVSSVFTTLYQDTNPDKFGGLAKTARALFDASIGNYDYDNMGDRELSFSVLQIVFVFFGNILLMNYLIAILSTTYENMKQTGIFKYKVNLYQYCERFMIAFNDQSYGELVLHPPPVSYLSTAMLPFIWSATVMRYVTMGFSYLMHWIENLLFIGGFIMFEGAIAPLAYVKIWINIIANSMSLLKTILNCLAWVVMGLPMIVFLILRDSTYLIKILGHHQGCQQA